MGTAVSYSLCESSKSLKLLEYLNFSLVYRGENFPYHLPNSEAFLAEDRRSGKREDVRLWNHTYLGHRQKTLTCFEYIIFLELKIMIFAEKKKGSKWSKMLYPQDQKADLYLFRTNSESQFTLLVGK